MIINGVEHKDVTITGNSNVQNMSMKIDEKAFSILIDKLYSRKKEAIVRELCSNACDAHIDAGIPHIPYDLVLPTLYNTDLVVRDYGKGLSKPDVEYYLGTLFGSKSADSNDSIGGFGLGAKSPFCLVDSYHITSYHEGMKHSFFYVREAGGIPKFVHLNSDVSNEKSGIKFTVNVGEENLRDWASVTERALGLFEVKPNCNVELNYPVTELYYDTVEIISGHGSYAKVLACMGGVVYPIDMSLGDIVRVDGFYNRVYSNYQQIVLRFDIGELDVAPSRESLEYRDRTITAINKKILELNNSVQKLEKLITDDIDSKLKVVPYSKIFTTPPISYFSVKSTYSMFSEDELADYPIIAQQYVDVKTLTFNAVIGSPRFKRIIKTLAGKGLDNSPNIIINNTSHSYKFVSEHVDNPNTVNIPKTVDEKTALFFLRRVCDFKFGANNYTLEYFKDYADKIPKEARERKSNVGYIVGVRDVYNDQKVRKVDVDFEDDTIVYAVNDHHKGKDGHYYSTSEIDTLLRYSAIQMDGTALKVTHNTEQRLGLVELDNAINLFDYIEQVQQDPLFIEDVAEYRSWSTYNSYAASRVYNYNINLLRVLLGNSCKHVNDTNLEVFQKAIIKARIHDLETKFKHSDDDISPLAYIEDKFSYGYGDTITTLRLLLANITVSKQNIIEQMKQTVKNMSVQDVADAL